MEARRGLRITAVRVSSSRDASKSGFKLIFTWAWGSYVQELLYLSWAFEGVKSARVRHVSAFSIIICTLGDLISIDIKGLICAIVKKD